MIFKRTHHPLPKFPPTVRPTFRNLCESLPVENVLAYKDEIENELVSIRERAKENSFINVALAEKLSEKCHLLLDIYEQYDRKKQALMVGAIRYFALANDSFSEEDFASGFDDDAKVMNHVLEELGIEDQFIDLD